MAKFDTSKIEGFDGMDDSAKLNALLNAEIPESVDMSQFVSKQTADKYASEAAEWKRKFNGKLSEDEKKSAEEAEKQKDLEEKYNALLKKSTIADYKSNYLAMGYDSKEADEIASALFDGDSVKMFEVMTKHSASMKEKIKEELLKGMPKPEGAGGGKPDEKTPDIVLAEKLSQQSKASNKAAQDGAKYYFK